MIQCSFGPECSKQMKMMVLGGERKWDLAQKSLQQLNSILAMDGNLKKTEHEGALPVGIWCFKWPPSDGQAMRKPMDAQALWSF